MNRDPHKMKVSIVEEEDVQRHQKRKGVNPHYGPVLLDQDNNITINDIERIVEKGIKPSKTSSKSFKQNKGGATRSGRNRPRIYGRKKTFKRMKMSTEAQNQEVNNPKENNRMNKVLMGHNERP